LRRIARRLARLSGLEPAYYSLRTRGLPEYVDPSASDLQVLEMELSERGVVSRDYRPDPAAFARFQRRIPFPDDYHGGPSHPVWTEKLLEHFIAFDLLQLEQFGRGDIYIDVAAHTSPWARLLREQLGVEAYALDLQLPENELGKLPYYLRGDATCTDFDDHSVAGISLQCAFEMFSGDTDLGLVNEAARILRPGGGLVISPLYMHRTYCCYRSPEYCRGGAEDGLAEFVRRNVRGVHFSRKYNPEKLLQRVWRPAQAVGLEPTLRVLRNKNLFEGAYCHFMLELRHPDTP
jgi:hypothetical protein